MSTTAKKRKTANTLLTCEHCGAEQQIIDDVNDLDTHKGLVEEWDDQHFDCGRPAGEVAVEKLGELLRQSAHQRVDLAAFAENHPRRPSWGLVSLPDRESQVCNKSDVQWRSETVRVPLLRHAGRQLSNGTVHCADMVVRLVQSVGSADPYILFRRLWWDGEKWAAADHFFVELNEAELLITALQGLIDIAHAETGDLRRHGQLSDTALEAVTE